MDRHSVPATLAHSEATAASGAEFADQAANAGIEGASQIGDDVVTSVTTRTEYVELETRGDLIDDLVDPSRPDLTEEIAAEMVDRRFAAIRFTNNDPNASVRAAQTREFLTTDVDGNPVVEAGVRVLDDTSAATYRFYGDEVLEEGADDLRRAVGELCATVPGNSFGSDMLVVLAGGQRLPISQVEPGQLVRTFDHDLGVGAIGTVTQVIAHPDVLYDVELSDGSTLVVTEDHPFFDPATGSYVPLESFGADDVLFVDGEQVVTVERIGEVNAETVAWDLGSAMVFVVAWEAREGQTSISRMGTTQPELTSKRA